MRSTFIDGRNRKHHYRFLSPHEVKGSKNFQTGAAVESVQLPNWMARIAPCHLDGGSKLQYVELSRA